MGRLIDADALYEKLQKDSTYDLDFMDSELREVIEEMPTAYDIEKVVAELEEETEVFTSFETMYIKYAIPKHKAIDIVRKGGVE